MNKLVWYVNRLKAMNSKEIIWRIQQKQLEVTEERNIKGLAVNSNVKKYMSIETKDKYLDSRIKLNYDNTLYSLYYIEKFWNEYPYEKDNEYTWDCGFQTNKKWPKEFSYKINFKEADEIGDVRTNWEVNRHHQFTQLAKLYYITKEEGYLLELKKQFNDWMKENPMLIGVAWASPMEVAIRVFSWVITLGFLEKAQCKDKEFMDEIKIAILNSTEYIAKHYSRYSSANNHLIVEMMAIGIVGVVFNIKEWINLCNDTLNYEMVNQNHMDGINKEQSPHYQCFVMESVLLYLLFCKNNDIAYSKDLDYILNKMCMYISDLSDLNGNVPNIGDCDEGKILDLSGQPFNHYKYVLELGSILLEKKYTDLSNVCENIHWLFDEDKINSVNEVYDNSKSKTYDLGGNSILKYKDEEKEIILTLDHGELGFGSVAAHGHADALSITLRVNGEPFLIDPGTYIYNIERPWRDYFRKTINHNTIEINGQNQSEIKGTFLWGKRANSNLIITRVGEKDDHITCEHDGYKSAIHNREVKYIKPDMFIIKDTIKGKFNEYIYTLVLDDELDIENIENGFILSSSKNKVYINFEHAEEIYLEEVWISKAYNNKKLSKAIKIKNKKNNELVTRIFINKDYRG